MWICIVPISTPVAGGRNGTRVTYMLERVDSLGGLLDLAADDLGDELGGELVEGAARRLPLDDLSHLLADGADLRRGSVRRLLDLVRSPLREGNGEEAEEVVVGGLDRDVGLDQRLPLADKRSQLVRREVQAVEVRQAVLALDLVHSELDLAESMVLILLQIGQRHLDNTTLQGIVRILQTRRPVHQGLSDTGTAHLLAWELRSWDIVHRDNGRTYSRMLKGAGAWRLLRLE